MIPELKAQIDNTINRLSAIENNGWIIYGKCKEDMQNYELTNNCWFNPQEWAEYIHHITDKLEI